MKARWAIRSKRSPPSPVRVSFKSLYHWQNLLLPLYLSFCLFSLMAWKGGQLQIVEFYWVRLRRVVRRSGRFVRDRGWLHIDLRMDLCFWWLQAWQPLSVLKRVSSLWLLSQTVVAAQLGENRLLDVSLLDAPDGLLLRTIWRDFNKNVLENKRYFPPNTRQMFRWGAKQNLRGIHCLFPFLYQKTVFVIFTKRCRMGT